MGKMWIGKPYLEKELNRMIALNESLKVVAEEYDINIHYLDGKIEGYKNVLMILKENR